MAAKKQPPETDSSMSSFETSLGELQEIVAKLEAGSTSLDESMQQFERGVGLLKSCYRVLEEAEQRIEILTGVDRDGQAHTEPFDASATFDSGEEATTPTRKTRSKPTRGELPF